MIREKLMSTVGWPAGMRSGSEQNGKEAQAYRLEHDSIGDRKVPADAYYGVQTLRAAENFRITGLRPNAIRLKDGTLLNEYAMIREINR